MPDSHRPQPRSSTPVQEWTCPGCGSSHLGKSGKCPTCSSQTQRKSSDELIKKVVDDNDLKKGF